ncbi:winged helix DNA-binding domain-containing protein [Suillus cothurnatus]|nr:winged helix DNA-binding domain-containing protein [Suillus cothurnatus]
MHAEGVFYMLFITLTFSHVVSWGPQGDCFVVKDMNEFTKSILPRMFKHSNFASFVRQLNKYDFHKVKTSDDAQFGEHSWTFRHPDFHADRRDALENIKRKVPAARKSFPSSSNGGHNGDKGASSSSYVPGETSTTELAAVQSYIGVLQNSYQLLFSSHDTLLSSHETLRGQTDSLLASHSSLQAQNDNLFATNGTLRNQVVRAEEQIRVLGRQYGDVLVETQDALMQGWIQFFLGEGGPRCLVDGSTTFVY